MRRPANDNRQSAANDNFVQPSSFQLLDLLDAIDWWREDATLSGALVDCEASDGGGFPYLPPQWTHESA